MDLGRIVRGRGKMSQAAPGTDRPDMPDIDVPPATKMKCRLGEAGDFSSWSVCGNMPVEMRA